MNFMKRFLGIDIGGTRVKSVVVSDKGDEIARNIRDTESDTADWPARVRDAIVMTVASHGPFASIGIAAPGLAAADGRSISWMKGRLESLEGLDWPSHLVLDCPVRVLNDAHAALLGEVSCGAARECKNVVMMTLGTGVGGAIVSDGRLLRGHLGRAGHLGHISLDPNAATDIVNTPGSLEDAIGECTLNVRSLGRYKSTAKLVEHYRDGDTEARRIWLDSIQQLAAGIASLINVVDPERVVIGGGIAEAGDALFDPLSADLDQFEWRPNGRRVQIVKAELGKFAGAFGAAYHVQKEVENTE
jgi:glucokinase